MQDVFGHESGAAESWRISEPEVMKTDHYLSSANAPDLEEDVRLCIASGAREMVLDCSALSYMTGAGARSFLKLARQMQEADGALFISGLNGQPLELFNACGMGSIIPVANAEPLPQTARASQAA